MYKICFNVIAILKFKLKKKVNFGLIFLLLPTSVRHCRRVDTCRIVNLIFVH